MGETAKVYIVISTNGKLLQAYLEENEAIRRAEYENVALKTLDCPNKFGVISMGFDIDEAVGMVKPPLEEQK